MKVYAVVTPLSDPHGESTDALKVRKMFSTREAAASYAKKLRERNKKDGGYQWTYSVRSYTMGA
jgi:hypothetical protein